MQAIDTSDRTVTLTACAGLIGALLLLIADFALYAHWGVLPPVSDSVAKVLGPRTAILLATPASLFFSSIVCPLVAILYVAGAWHVYARLKIASVGGARMAAMLFALVAVMSSVYHALWSQYGFALQVTNQYPHLTGNLVGVASNHMKQSLNIATIVGLAQIVVMSVLVIRGKSAYPRWTVLINPFLLYGIATPMLLPLANGLPNPYGALILSSLSEVTMSLFFAFSLVTSRRS
jgi:hypothetical protein